MKKLLITLCSLIYLVLCSTPFFAAEYPGNQKAESNVTIRFTDTVIQDTNHRDKGELSLLGETETEAIILLGTFFILGVIILVYLRKRERNEENNDV